MQILNTQGVVLRSLKFNENDLILTIYTKKFGKVSALAKGAQRQKSRFLSSSQVFSYNNYVLKKQKDMYVVYQSDNIKSFYNISSDFEAFSYASFISKLMENTSDESLNNYKLFELLIKTLFLLSEDTEDKLFILDSFILKFIDDAGYKPVVNRCVHCGDEKYKWAVFSIDEGGIVCNKCVRKDNFYIKIDQTTISLMQFILNNDIIVVSKAKVSKILINELYYILKKYLINYFDNVDFKSIDLLKKLK